MKTATSLLVRTAPEPQFGISSVAADQVPLPLAGFSPLPFSPSPLAPPEEPRADPLHRRARQFMQVLVEVLSGERASRHLGVWMSPDVYDQLQRQLHAVSRAPRRSRINAGARVMSVHVAMVSDTKAEIAARMSQGGRSRALAVRLELHTTLRGLHQWRCTALTWA